MSSLDPAGPAAREIATLWWVMLTGSALILALVLALVAMAFRPRNPDPNRPTARENLWIVWLGLVFPVTVLAALLAYGLIIGERLLAHDHDGVTTVRAEGRQWSWSFAYGDVPGLTTENVLHIPAGQPVDVAITSTDVIHSFWVPRLAGKLDAIPGHVNRLRIEADEPGSYAGHSSEFSGAGYADHVFDVIAHDPEGWQRFLDGENK